MKKITLLLSFFLVIITATCFAQNDCKLCGDWMGIYTIQVPDPNPDGGIIDEDERMYIRIKQLGNEMSVRVKICPVKEPNNVHYWSDCEITNLTDTSISFTSFIKDDYDWNNSDRKNGRVIEKASYYALCCISYYNGKIVMSYHMHVDYYDKYSALIQGRNFGYETITLYQGDDDW